MENLWFPPPPKDVIKFNVHATHLELPAKNGNIGIIVRNHEGAFLWGIMGPLRGMGRVQAQVWIIHQAMKLGFLKDVPHLIIDTATFEAINDQDPDFMEEEDIVLPIKQINTLLAEYNIEESDGKQLRSCKIHEVFATRSWAAHFLAEYGISQCTSLVKVLHPFGELREIVDLDRELGPHWPVFGINPNFGLGEVIHECRQNRDLKGSSSRVHVKADFFNYLLDQAGTEKVERFFKKKAKGKLPMEAGVLDKQLGIKRENGEDSVKQMVDGLYLDKEKKPVYVDAPVVQAQDQVLASGFSSAVQLSGEGKVMELVVLDD